MEQYLVNAPGDKPKLDLDEQRRAQMHFETMRIPLYMGREFTWSDTKSSGLKIILNQAAAKLFFPDRNALGQQVLDSRTQDSYEVVAIVGDAKYRDIRTPALSRRIRPYPAG